jgi:hypothetical protein
MSEPVETPTTEYRMAYLRQAEPGGPVELVLSRDGKSAEVIVLRDGQKRQFGIDGPRFALSRRNG